MFTEKLQQLFNCLETKQYKYTYSENDRFVLIDIYEEITHKSYEIDEYIKSCNIDLDIQYHFPEIIMNSDKIYYVGISQIPPEIECFSLKVNK